MRTLQWTWSLALAAAVIIGHFAPWWLVAFLAAGWLFNAAIYWRRGRQEQAKP